MSVINKMLKDLDQRQEGETEFTAPNTVSFQAKPKSRGIVLASLVFLVVLLLAVIAWMLWLQLQSNESNQSSSPSLAATSLSSTSNQAVAKVTADTAPERVPLGTSEKTEQEEKQLLAEATNSSNTSPAINDNEKDVITSSSEATSSNEVAGREPRNTLDAEIYEIQQQSEPPTPPIAEKTTQDSDAVFVASVDEVTTTDKTVVATVDKTQEVAKNQPPQANDTELTQTPSFSIEKSSAKMSPEQRVEKLMQQAKSSFDKGYITEAIEQLKQLLLLSDGHVEARNLLAAAWYGRGENTQAISVLNDGLQRYPLIEQWRLTASKIFFKANNFSGAYSYLEVDLDNASKEFYTMKATLARQLNKLSAAEQVYNKLIQLEPNTSNWWLGLALVQDGQQKFNAAKASYSQVASFGGLSADTMTFVQQRLQQLQEQ